MELFRLAHAHLNAAEEIAKRVADEMSAAEPQAAPLLTNAVEREALRVAIGHLHELLNKQKS